ncbi:hypothetical protein I4U23_015390 [Adineta vaga]|nr:hypothetical protein I4U23_015390 [Adineta vaga]
MSSRYSFRQRRRLLPMYNHRTRSTRKYCGLTRKEILTILTSLALPLMLGIFTVVITFDQKYSAAQQRLEDRRLADEQREQDLNISREQRREDREIAREQRFQDLNQTTLQREVERTIANERRNQTEQNRKHELTLEDKHYQDGLLTNYIIEISDLLEKNNGSLTKTDLIAKLTRLKTLTLIRQLDSNRISQVIRLLYDAGQLDTRPKSSLDLTDAELHNLNLNSTKPRGHMNHIHLSNVDLTGSSFAHQDLNGSNFSLSILRDVNFSSTILTHLDFSGAIFNGSFNIQNAFLHNINFVNADLKGIDFTSITKPYSNANEWFRNGYLLSMNFSNTQLQYTCFVGVNFGSVYFQGDLDLINFSNTSFGFTIFERVSAQNLDFSYAELSGDVIFSDLRDLMNVTFYMATLDNVKLLARDGSTRFGKNNFNFAHMKQIEFLNLPFSQSSFINTTINDSTFFTSYFEDCLLMNMTMSNVIFQGSIIDVNLENANFQDNVTFSDYTYFFRDTFHRAQMQNITANLCEFYQVNMYEANLTNAKMFASRLLESNLMKVDLTGADLSMVDLSHSNLLNAHITDEQFHAAFSIENTTLPNGTIAHDSRLIQNGYPQCNRSLEQDWKVEPPYSIVTSKQTEENNCVFLSVRSLTKAKMNQRINMTRYQSIISRRLCSVHLNGNCNSYVKFTIIERNVNEKILNVWKVFEHSDSRILNVATTDLEIEVLFDTSDNHTAICSNIHLKIELL